jgi:hypothetical protein
MSRTTRRSSRRQPKPNGRRAREDEPAMNYERLSRAVLQVGRGRDVGRGFVVKLGTGRAVITAAHCLPKAWLPPPHPGRYLSEVTRRLLGPLGAKPSVWATCLFVDLIADLAVLGQPDEQAMSDEADAYHESVEGMETMVIADAPAEGSEMRSYSGVIHVGGIAYTEEFPPIPVQTPGVGAAYALSLDGRWVEGRVHRKNGWLAFEPKKLIQSGMSGSPIISATGAAIGVVSVDHMNPVLVDSLSARLLREIAAS